MKNNDQDQVCTHCGGGKRAALVDLILGELEGPERPWKDIIRRAIERSDADRKTIRETAKP